MENVLLNGDCLELMKDIPSGSVDLILTAPPYCVGATSNGVRASYNDNSLMKPFFKELFGEYQRLLKDAGHVYICTDWRTYPFLYPLVQSYFQMRNLIIWNKAPYMLAGNWYRFSHEFIMFATKGKSKREFAANFRDIWQIPVETMVATQNRNHPSEKPVALMEMAILNSAKEGDVVLDSFMGSGSTCVAAVNTGRKYIGIELDEHFYEVACKRVAEATTRN